MNRSAARRKAKEAIKEQRESERRARGIILAQSKANRDNFRSLFFREAEEIEAKAPLALPPEYRAVTYPDPALPWWKRVLAWIRRKVGR